MAWPPSASAAGRPQRLLLRGRIEDLTAKPALRPPPGGPIRRIPLERGAKLAKVYQPRINTNEHKQIWNRQDAKDAKIKKNIRDVVVA